MRAITVMYDSLNKLFLQPYGCQNGLTPNFQRLAEKSCVFDKFYCGSMPCMPARREMHTGRLNFLHRSWSPLEPYDESCVELMSNNGIHTHFISDHEHYWHDGGLNYHCKFTTYEFIRGQEGDAWKGEVEGFQGNNKIRVQDKINRKYIQKEEDHCHVRAFNSAIEFLDKNKNQDNWYLHLEYFDPHEPFFAPERFKKLVDEKCDDIDWPPYAKIDESNIKDFESYKKNYLALLCMCDEYLGKLLDYFDQNDMWKDTMLIVNTDHGYLLGEHGCYAKNYMPCYSELTNIPFFIAIPNSDRKRSDKIAQTIDIPVTILDYFGIEKGECMQGKSLLDVVNNDATIRNYALFGNFGKHVNITDGRYIYMRAAQNKDNTPLYNYTLMPQHIWQNFTIEELRGAEEKLDYSFSFTKGVGLVKYPTNDNYNPNRPLYKYKSHIDYGTLLFDLENDKNQENNIVDKELENKMIIEMVKLMKENESPKEQYTRLGIEDFV